jgi:tellurite resistance protein
MINMIERFKKQIEDAERLLHQVEVELAVAIIDGDTDKASILVAAKLGFLSEIHDMKVQLFKRELSEVR